jgi:glucosamine 6-phosphate synthetase-like amidotransferase/phosphosugar isomerase protein
LTTDNETYRVNIIKKVDGNIILTTQTNSSLAKKMSSLVTEIYTDKDQAKLEIPSENIKGFYLKDDKRSTVATVAAILTPILVVTALVVIAYVSALNNLFGS